MRFGACLASTLAGRMRSRWTTGYLAATLVGHTEAARPIKQKAEAQLGTIGSGKQRGSYSLQHGVFSLWRPGDSGARTDQNLDSPQAGQSTQVMIHLNMMLPLQEQGVYQFRLVYIRPAFTAHEWQEIKEARIELPVADAESEPINVELLSGRITLLPAVP
jgi:hypothetical protein